MSQHLIRFIVVSFLVAVASTGALAQNTAAPAATGATPPASSTPVAAANEPPAWLKLGGDVRFRNEYLNNAFSLSGAAAGHEIDYFRLRTRLWAAFTLDPDVIVNARLANETRYWVHRSFVKQYVGTGAEWRYVSFDNLNLKWTKALDLPLTITIGRQDLMFGDPLNWWLVVDGTPDDGSWTLYLDAARFTFDAKDLKTKFDLVYIDQKAHPGGALPVFGREGIYSLTSQNEKGLILYASNKSVPNTQVDYYFIYKRDEKVFSPGDNADIYTLGSKVTGQPSPNWQYSLEGAYQWGQKQDGTVKTPVLATQKRDIASWGANAKLTYLLKDPQNNQFSLVGEYLTGDDPNTKNKDEMFDVLWGRWPRFSELYIYSYVMETSGKFAQLNNIFRVGPSWSITPQKGTTFSATYNAFFAPEATPTRTLNAALFSRNGHFRGHYFQFVLKRQFSQHWSGHLWAEWVFQGDYYARRDTLSFLRAELMTTF